jgi:hypothetical protein
MQLIALNSPSLPIVIPPIYGLAGVELETVTADGPISYWNSYVGVGQRQHRPQRSVSGHCGDPRRVESPVRSIRSYRRAISCKTSRGFSVELGSLSDGLAS